MAKVFPLHDAQIQTDRKIELRGADGYTVGGNDMNGVK